MGYILYSTLFVFLSVSTAAYVTRSKWLAHLQTLPYPHLYTAVSNTFAADIESGLTSSTFDLNANLTGDQRAGLDDATKTEILKIMKGGWFSGPVSFDEARRIQMERSLERQGIGKDGMPRDPKMVTFGRR